MEKQSLYELEEQLENVNKSLFKNWKNSNQKMEEKCIAESPIPNVQFQNKK